MDIVDVDHGAPGRPHGAPGADAAEAVTALYRAHAVGLIRLAIITLGDRAAAEDVVQEAFLSLYRHWGDVWDPARTLPYLRTTVLNGCRSALRRETRRDRRERVHGWAGPDWNTAEYHVLLAEEHRATLAAIRRLPDRQREALVLRFYLDLPEDQVA
ncbi:MAG TPA: sigma-70 family RNA polymerase sigma factor, partial [Trebonia sp.]